MGRKVLTASTIVVCALLMGASAARAQHWMPDPFRDEGPRVEEPLSSEQVFLADMRLREERLPIVRDGTGFRLSLGSVELLGQGTSYYPADNQKVRNESLHLAWALSEHTDVLLGAWRFKHRREGLDGMRAVTVGIGARYRF
ncbi:MAG TPA: hypothetical protein VGE23_02805 [Candidatus Paceibacterota bacterium]